MIHAIQGALMASWVVFGALFVINAMRVYKDRKADPNGEAGRTVDWRATVGMMLEGAALFLAFLPRRYPEQPPDIVLLLAVTIAAGSILLAWFALRQLGRQWRILAVVTESHELVTTGPYGLVRHPVYTSLMGMALATGIIISTWQLTLLAMAIYIAGTEIRVRVEDRLLSRRFGASAIEYQSRVSAYIPFLR